MFVRILLLHFQQLQTSNYKAAFAIVVCQTKRQLNLQQTATAEPAKVPVVSPSAATVQQQQQQRTVILNVRSIKIKPFDTCSR